MSARRCLRQPYGAFVPRIRAGGSARPVSPIFPAARAQVRFGARASPWSSLIGAILLPPRFTSALTGCRVDNRAEPDLCPPRFTVRSPRMSIPMPPTYGGTFSGDADNPTDTELLSAQVGRMDMSPDQGGHTSMPVFGLAPRSLQCSSSACPGTPSPDVRDIVVLTSEAGNCD